MESTPTPTPEMLAAGWSVLNRHKAAARIYKIGPGPGLAEVYAAMQKAAPKVELSPEMRRLIIAARQVTDAGLHTQEDRELFEAVEAFSEQVPYDEQPADDIGPSDGEIYSPASFGGDVKAKEAFVASLFVSNSGVKYESEVKHPPELTEADFHANYLRLRKIVDIAVRMGDAAYASPVLHTFVSDGNVEDQSIQSCLTGRARRPEEKQLCEDALSLSLDDRYIAVALDNEPNLLELLHQAFAAPVVPDKGMLSGQDDVIDIDFRAAARYYSSLATGTALEKTYVELLRRYEEDENLDPLVWILSVHRRNGPAGKGV